jgi:hypothetical protein
MYFVPFHVHALAGFTVAVFVWYWRRTADNRSTRQWAIWGLSGGLMIGVYYVTRFFFRSPHGRWCGSGSVSVDRPPPVPRR